MDLLRTQLSLVETTAGRRAMSAPAVSSTWQRWALLAALGALGCDRSADVSGQSAEPQTTRAAAPAGGVVDSALPLDEALRRFRAGLPLVDSLARGAASRDELVRRFVRAVESSDTAALRAMIISRAEFAYLYYPTSPYTRDPTKQAAALAWFFVIEPSTVGITRVLNRFGGTSLEYQGYSCPANAKREGNNVVWEACTLRGRNAVLRVFGPILERHGRFKFLSYENDF